MSYGNIPADMQKLCQWVCWKNENGVKILKQATGRCVRNAKVNDKRTWRSFQEAVEKSKFADGIGFVFSENDPYIGIDMDNKQGLKEIDDNHQIWIKNFNSYTERSPSGKGYHVIIKGEQIKGFNQSPYEAYSQGRYFTFTGDVVLNLPIIENKRALGDFIETFNSSDKESFIMPDAIEVGNRNDTMFRLACSLLSRGMSKEDTVLLISGFNRGLDKPLSGGELKQLLSSAGSYEYQSEEYENIYDWLLDNMVWVSAQNCYWDYSQNGFIAKESLDQAYYKDMPEDEEGKRIPPSIFLRSAINQKVVYNIGWYPTKGEVYEWRGQDILNTYIPSNSVPKRGTPAPWIRHLEWLVKDKEVQNQLLDWMAFNVQNPEGKLNYGVFLGGPERVGKDMLFSPLVKILGEHNCKEIGSDILYDNFNEYLYQTKLLIVGEMHTKLTEQRSTENKLKTMLANTASDSIRINMKGKNPIYIPNLVSVIFMSNHRDGLTITGDNAARYLCYWSDVVRKEDIYYENFGKWLDDFNNINAIHYFLANRDISKFNPKASAIVNDFTREIVEISRDGLETEIIARIEDKITPFHNNLVTIDDIAINLQLDILKNRVKISKILKKLGYEKRKAVGRLNGQLTSKRLYIIRGNDMYGHMKDSELLKQYQKSHKL